jgi:uncharacterized membrane protein (UPF0136 family)
MESVVINPGILAAIAYGTLAIIGGIVGFLQVQSKASLISGSISGLLLIGAAVLQLQGFAWGLPLAAAITTLLIIVFVSRWTKTRKFMPAGLMIILGVAALGVMLYTLRG